MQQRQQMNYDLLAVFNNESDADAAETKLHKEGFGDDEVFRLAADSVTGAQFREQGPNPVTVIVLAIVFGLILGVVLFGVADFAVKTLPLLPFTPVGVAVGIILGAILGLLRRGRVRGAIGQDLSRVNASNTRPELGARTAIAVRLPDPGNISRKSKARAILLNNKGKIDRSVSRGDS